MTHILDRPVWSALATRHAPLSRGSTLARRFDPTIVPFAAARDESDEALDALTALADPQETMIIVETETVALPPKLTAVLQAAAVQMILKRPPPPVDDPRIERLTEADAAEMLQLATLTKPGPFTLRAQALGAFFGVRIDGRLAAMAGERLKQDGFAELSGVCVHPDFQGRGLARLLSVFVTHRILERGETPYLHAYATNRPAITLYETIGFELRSMMNVMVVRAV